MMLWCLKVVPVAYTNDVIENVSEGLHATVIQHVPPPIAPLASFEDNQYETVDNLYRLGGYIYHALRTILRLNGH